MAKRLPESYIAEHIKAFTDADQARVKELLTATYGKWADNEDMPDWAARIAATGEDPTAGKKILLDVVRNKETGQIVAFTSTELWPNSSKENMQELIPLGGYSVGEIIKKHDPSFPAVAVGQDDSHKLKYAVDPKLFSAAIEATKNGSDQQLDALTSSHPET